MCIAHFIVIVYIYLGGSVENLKSPSLLTVFCAPFARGLGKVQPPASPRVPPPLRQPLLPAVAQGAEEKAGGCKFAPVAPQPQANP